MYCENVFINCPFDNEYFPLLKPILYTLIYIGYNPVIAETIDSGEVRILGLKNLMVNSKFSIHDISRMNLSPNEEIPRFNMPFECGIDFGLKYSENSPCGDKCFLILDAEQYRYHKAISDISGNDIKFHKNEPEILVKSIRDWFTSINLSKLKTKKKLPKYIDIWTSYNEFTSYFEEIMEEEKNDPKDIYSIPFSEIILSMEEYINNNVYQLIAS